MLDEEIDVPSKRTTHYRKTREKLRVVRGRDSREREERDEEMSDRVRQPNDSWIGRAVGGSRSDDDRVATRFGRRSGAGTTTTAAQ